MAQTFRIATSSKLGQFNVIGDKSKVTEQLFWQIVKSKVKEITETQPEKFDEVIELVRTHLQKQSIVIIDTWLEIKGKA
ncbi:MAG: hypothetical protein ACK5JD_06255 [Mangrovibacterium sp.]